MYNPFPITQMIQTGESITHFQVFGDRNSGTNLARVLLSDNTELDHVGHYGWKHGIPNMVAFTPGALIVLVTRNAVDWSKSMYKLPQRYVTEDPNVPFSEFLRTPWSANVGRKPRRNWGKPWSMGSQEIWAGQELQLDRHPLTGLPYLDILEMRSVKLAAMMGLANRGVSFVQIRFEDLQKAPIDFVTQVSESFNLSKTETLTAPKHRVSPARFSGRELKIPDPIPPSDQLFILTKLDEAIEARAGYRYAADGSVLLL
ncbi:MAG: hypothetical protein ABJO67_15300 [Pseudoruegeria sp.]